MFSEQYVLDKIAYWNNELNKIQRGHERTYPDMQYTNDIRYRYRRYQDNYNKWRRTFNRGY